MYVYLLLNFVSFCYMVIVKPFEHTHLNVLNIVNELIGLLAAYWLLPLQDLEYGADTYYMMGFFTVYTFEAAAVIDIMIILVISTRDLHRLVKRKYARRELCFRLCKK